MATKNTPFLEPAHVVVAWSLAFSFVFARGFENRGWLAGVRFGLIVWLLYFVTMTLGIYGYFVVGPEWTLSR